MAEDSGNTAQMQTGNSGASAAGDDTGRGDCSSVGSGKVWPWLPYQSRVCGSPGAQEAAHVVALDGCKTAGVAGSVRSRLLRFGCSLQTLTAHSGHSEQAWFSFQSPLQWTKALTLP